MGQADNETPILPEIIDAEQPTSAHKTPGKEMIRRYSELCQKAIDLGLIESFDVNIAYDAMVQSDYDVKALIAEFESQIKTEESEE
jgi:predicted component of type VI protein secretion system